MPTTAPLPLYLTASIRKLEARYLPDAQPSLMERAGTAAADVAWNMLHGRPGRVLVAAGPGNNGGDGFVLARRLKARNCDVVVAFAGEVEKLTADAAQAITDWGAAGGDVVTELPHGTFDLAVDALFGIGLSRPLEGRNRGWVEFLNSLSCPILALDVPSGLDADTGRVWGEAVQAQHTATFIAAKPGLYTLDGPDHAGSISIHTLGLEVTESAEPDGYSVRPPLFAKSLRPRPKNSHKGMNGSAGILAGAPGMVGAALLAGRATMLLGAGRVYLGLLDGSGPTLDPLYPELMMRRPESLFDFGLCTCLAAGPGMGQSERAAELLSHAITVPHPLVLDADALNLLALDPILSRHVVDRRAPTILTPHPAEASRLLACTVEDIEDNRITAAQEITRRWRAFTVLKGCGSVLTAPGNRWWINTSGNPGLASAGMGDVLSGILLALLAQDWDTEHAVLAAVHLHGQAAEACAARQQGPIGLTGLELAHSARQLLNHWITAHA